MDADVETTLVPSVFPNIWQTSAYEQNVAAQLEDFYAEHQLYQCQH